MIGGDILVAGTYEASLRDDVLILSHSSSFEASTLNSRDENVAIAACRELLCTEIADYLTQQSREPQTAVFKDDKSPVTAADEALQALLEGEIRSAEPGALFICEESDASNYPSFEAIRAIGAVYSIDPIDGTSNFANGIENYATSVARCEVIDNLPIPTDGVILRASQGECVSTQDSQVLRLDLRYGSHRSVLDSPLRRESLDLSFSVNENPVFENSDWPTRRVRDLGSTVTHLHHAALGRVGFGFTSGYLWDVAAAVAIGRNLGVRLYRLADLQEVQGFEANDFYQADSKDESSPCTFRLKEQFVLCKPEALQQLRKWKQGREDS